MRAPDQALLNGEVGSNEVCGPGAVRFDSTDQCRRIYHNVWLFCGQETQSRRLVGEVKFCASSNDDPRVTVPLKGSNDRGAHQATMARDENLGICVDLFSISIAAKGS